MEGEHHGFSVSRRQSRQEIEAAASEEAAGAPEILNTRAVDVIHRVSNKLSGRDFLPTQTLDVPTQVDRLIQQATSLENLCQCYVGWYVVVHVIMISNDTYQKFIVLSFQVCILVNVKFSIAWAQTVVFARTCFEAFAFFYYYYFWLWSPIPFVYIKQSIYTLCLLCEHFNMESY